MIEWRLRIDRLLRPLGWRWYYVVEGWYPDQREPAFVHKNELLFKDEETARSAGVAEVTKLTARDVRKDHRKPPFWL